MRRSVLLLLTCLLALATGVALLAAEVAAAVPPVAGEGDWSFPQEAHVLLAHA